MSTMDQWTAAVCADLGLDASAADLRAVLDLTRDVAHGVARPAAPLTAYLVGVAVGRGLTLPDAAGRVSALAASWEKAKKRTNKVPNGPGHRPGDRGGPCRPGYRTLTDPVTPGARRPASPKTGSRGGRRRAKGGR